MTRIIMKVKMTTLYIMVTDYLVFSITTIVYINQSLNENKSVLNCTKSVSA
jgi:hypothetical protein